MKTRKKKQAKDGTYIVTIYQEMRTLNVFKIARNQDFNVIKATSDSSSFSSCAKVDGNNKNIFSTITTTSSSKKKSLMMNGGSDSQSNHHHPPYPTYTQIDPDLMMSEQLEGRLEAGQENVLDNDGGDDDDAVVNNINLQQVSVNINGGHHHPPCDDEGHHHENGTSHNGGRPSNGIHSHQAYEPECYKRLINEAPFMTTLREPPIDMDHETDHDPLSEKSQDVTDARPSRLSIGSKSNRSSHLSMSKAESTISMSCTTSTSFDLELDWIDHDLVKDGRKFVRRHFLSVFFAHFIGLAFLLTVRPIAAILLRNGKFHKPAKRHNWHMYLHFFRRLKSWYEKGDLTDTNDPATAEVLHLRKCICTAGKNFKKYLPPPAQDLKLSDDEEKLVLAFKQDLQKIPDIQVETKNIAKIFATVNPDVPWSQYDVAICQFAFFGFISLFPRVFGIYDSKDSRGVKGFIHLWAVLGHLLGLENRFNLCKEENFDEETNKKIFKHVFLFSFKITDNGSFRMLQLMCTGYTWCTIFISRIQLVLVFMVQEVAEVTSTNLYATMKWYDRVQFIGYCTWTHWLVRIFFLRILGNFFARIVLVVANLVFMVQKRFKAKRKPQTFPSSLTIQA